MTQFIDFEEWTEDDGPALWFKLHPDDIVDFAYWGDPRDTNWPFASSDVIVWHNPDVEPHEWVDLIRRKFPAEIEASDA